MKEVALSECKEELSKYLHIAEEEPVLITRDGSPAGVLIDFESDEDWSDYRLESDPRFLKRVAEARRSIRDGEGTVLEDAPVDEARSLRGIGWEGDLDEMRSGRDAGRP
jgi:prevent-host-death family protein